MCPSCKSQLTRKHPKQPRNALANFQYYGTNELPQDVLKSFKAASPFDLMLVSRARASQIMHYYRANRGYYQAEETSQRYSKGNTAVLPQDAVSVHMYLPPDVKEVSQSMCTLFTGSGIHPTSENIRNLRPILVSTANVKSMIDFLITKNGWYRSSGVQFSKDNLNNLLNAHDSVQGIGVPVGVELCSLQTDADTPNVGVDDVVGVSLTASDDIYMDSVGYTNGDHTPANRHFRTPILRVY
ncbi:hypothetical protein BJ138DRAFT_1019784 [Hygrophoropsis aurantiaca]|uniref:Uncharacterized protein n=1 Tax=Hygrophoropsis aurantiaca TaxID=72124 RepID=A0ACB7ZSB8_9AGAM|nr:hypothetical protein BJ138DRAFT_1019784 [Hygrophoropsis aurantiaca]